MSTTTCWSFPGAPTALLVCDPLTSSPGSGQSGGLIAGRPCGPWNPLSEAASTMAPERSCATISSTENVSACASNGPKSLPQHATGSRRFRATVALDGKRTGFQTNGMMDAMSNTRPTVAEKRRAFHQLHEAGCFVIPNPWDVGSALYLQSLGFKALATTSSGFAWSQGRVDCGMSRDQVLAHLASIVAATDVPVNADFENGFARDAAEVAQSVALAVQTGVAGLSIEDSSGVAERPLFDVGTAVERIRAARRAIDKSGGDTLLVGRAECFLAGRPDLEETIARLKAYANAGADCLYAPGLRTREDIASVVTAVAPKPVNLLIGSVSELTMRDVAALGVRRISVGGALARSAWGGFMRAAKLIAEEGRFDAFSDAASGRDLEAIFRKR